MRTLGFVLLFLVSFGATVIWKFPAAAVLAHVNIQPLVLAGVTGSVWNGSAANVIAPPPAVPLTNVKWRFLPASLLSGNTAANVDLELLGGTGTANVTRSLSGDLSLSDGQFLLPAESLGQFLPLPVADFGGRIIADIEKLEMQDNLLKTTYGTIVWRNALITGLIEAKLGQVVLDVVPKPVDGKPSHEGKLSNKDGDLDIKGEFRLDMNGNYQADIRLKPTATTSPGLIGALGSLGPIARRESDGSYRIRNKGNIRNLM